MLMSNRDQIVCKSWWNTCVQISRLCERHDMCVYYVMCCQPGHFKLLFNWATVLDRPPTFWIQNTSGPFPITFPRSYHYPKTDCIGRVPWSCVMSMSASSIMWQETSSVTVKCEVSQSLNSVHLWRNNQASFSDRGGAVKGMVVWRWRWWES